MTDTKASLELLAQKIEEYNQLLSGTLLYANNERRPFYEFSNTYSEVNWSDSLEDMHDESKTDAHPIDIYERKTVLDYIRGYLSATSNPVICDFGCSTGFMLQDIENEKPDSTLIGVDIVESGLFKLHKRNPNYMLFKFDITEIPFPDNFLDCIVCLNVLEHIENDELVLNEFNRVLKNDGICCVVVPYGDKLYDYYDEALMHVRRYGKSELIRKLEKNGYRGGVVKHGHLNSLMYIPFFLKKKLNRVLHKNTSDDKIDRIAVDIKNSSGSSLMKSMFALDYWISGKCRFPFGIREIVLAEKE
jgi:ubiquinone/menaquinone biosynthesis C-methylase UbiE